MPALLATNTSMTCDSCVLCSRPCRRATTPRGSARRVRARSPTAQCRLREEGDTEHGGNWRYRWPRADIISGVPPRVAWRCAMTPAARQRRADDEDDDRLDARASHRAESPQPAIRCERRRQPGGQDITYVPTRGPCISRRCSTWRRGAWWPRTVHARRRARGERVAHGDARDGRHLDWILTIWTARPRLRRLPGDPRRARHAPEHESQRELLGQCGGGELLRHARTGVDREGSVGRRAMMRRAIFRYIETWYNRTRRHSTLGYVSPAVYEERLQNAA